ncbi:MFS transporter [Noviherbaspirillum denitrificans]|uniref:MFS transporter n=1 Tax=Noviherbaspirillum denitrificans TaxID=1968433 RepID=A0A254T8V1_9BURK|nr:MFS transporter [Noviherbaspirillum denitrificans]OWW19066.1 MFS transporter [Noviherbaspirillum denitrificans]
MSTPQLSSAAESPAAQGESYRWVVLGVAVAAQTMAAVVSQGVYTLVPFWQSAFQLSQASAGLAVTFMNAGQILSMVLLGMAIDRHGERNVVALTMIAMGLSAFGAAAFGTHYVSLLLFLTMLGAWYASVQPGGTRAIMRWFPPHLRGIATGVRQAGLPLGTAAAAMALPLLAVRYGWQTAVYVQGVVGIAGGILFGLFHRDNVGDVAAPGASPRLRELVALLSKNPAFWPVLIAGVAMATFQYTFSAHVLLFLSRQLEIPIVTAAFIFAVAQGVGIAGRVSLAGISDRLWPGRRMRSLGWTMCACAAVVTVLMLLPVQPPMWLMVTLFAVLGLFGIGWYPLWLLQVAEMAPKTAMASTVSFAMTLNLVAISAMPPLFGLAVDLGGYRTAWTLLIALLVLGALQLKRVPRQAA